MNLPIPPVDELEKIADIAVKSGFYKGLKTKEQALAKILYGWELGLPPMASLTGVYVMISKEGMILSQPTLTAPCMATLIKKHGYKLKRLQHDEKASRIQIIDHSGEVAGESVFGAEQAKTAELTSGPNAHMYRKYPANMFWSRNIANIARQECSEVFGGQPVYTPEEMDIPVDAEGNPLEGAEEYEKPLRQRANEELAAAGQPPMLTKEEAKAAGVKQPSRKKTDAPATSEKSDTQEPTESKPVSTAGAAEKSQNDPKPESAPSASSEPSTKSDPGAANVNPATSSSTPERPGKADKDALLQLYFDKHDGMSADEAKKAASTILSNYLTEKKVLPDGVPMKEFLSHWTWDHYEELKGKMVA